MNDKKLKDIELIIDKARIKLMQAESSFFGHVLLQLKQEWSGEKFGVNTVAVSVDTIFYNMEFLANNVKSVSDMSFIFMHEIMHLVLDHLNKNRISDRDMKVWNMAGDHVINLDLFSSGYNFSGKEKLLCDPRFKGKNTEEVYDILIKENIPVQSMWDDIISSEDGTEIGSIKEMIASAYNSHVLEHGSDDSLPPMIKYAIGEIKSQILPWQSLLQKFIGEVTQNDFSWEKINLSFLPEFYIPSLYDQSLSKIDFAIDISGSIDSKTFNKFINEIKNILMLYNITKIGIYQFNTKTVSYDVVSNLSELSSVEFNGGGGTDVADTLRQSNLTDSVALFIITDGYMNLNLQPIRKPVVWCVYNNKKFEAPFGQTILFDHYI